MNVYDEHGNLTGSFGSFGSGPGQFNTPTGVAVGCDGAVYVADLYNYRIQKFSADGTFLTQWGSYGSGEGQFAYPLKVSVDRDGSVFVLDVSNYRIEEFSDAVTPARTATWGQVKALWR